MYTQSAKYYDALYHSLGKGYAQEAERIDRIVKERCRSGGNALLERRLRHRKTHSGAERAV